MAISGQKREKDYFWAVGALLCALHSPSLSSRSFPLSRGETTTTCHQWQQKVTSELQQLQWHQQEAKKLWLGERERAWAREPNQPIFKLQLTQATTEPASSYSTQLLAVATLTFEDSFVESLAHCHFYIIHIYPLQKGATPWFFLLFLTHTHNDWQKDQNSECTIETFHNYGFVVHISSYILYVSFLESHDLGCKKFSWGCNLDSIS